MVLKITGETHFYRPQVLKINVQNFENFKSCNFIFLLVELRKPGETGYKIPHGGMFTYVSGANFCGEIIEWFGFAMATGFNLPATTFALNTSLNLSQFTN